LPPGSGPPSEPHESHPPPRHGELNPRPPRIPRSTPARDLRGLRVE
jgi:hypothetical protein